MFCQNCGCPLEAAAKFCTDCGSPNLQAKLAPRSTALSEPAPRTTSPVFEQAEYGVPHCQFEQTPEGFKVSFNKLTATQITLALLLSLVGMIFGLAVFAYLGAVVAGLAGLFLGMIGGGGIGMTIPLFVLLKRGESSHIEVTKDSVIIDGKVLNRTDFRNFRVGGTTPHRGRMLSEGQLGYTYGVRSFGFGGIWGHGQATEVATALNDHLRKVPLAGQEQQPSPEHLRDAARPTNF